MAAPQLTTRILRRLLASGFTDRAEKLLARLHPADLAPLLSGLSPEELHKVLELLFHHHRAATTLMELPREMLPQIIETQSNERLGEVISRLEIDDMLEFVDWIPEERRESIIQLLSTAKREELSKGRLYPHASAGRVMTTRFVALNEEMTAQEAIDRIRAEGEDTQTILYLYVVDEQFHLKGVVPIRRLVQAKPDRICRDLMIPDPIAVSAEADQEEVSQIVARYNLLAVPVIDAAADSRMLGVITVDDVIDVINQEATEDMYHLAGLSEEDRVFTPALQSIRKRLPWMLLNLVTAFAAAWVVGLFEHSIEKVAALAIFMPVVAGMGGNGGVQTLTVITRGIALGEIEFSTGIRAILKEISVSLALGCATGILAGAAAYSWRGNPYLGFVLFLAMVANMALAGFIGAFVPLTLKTLRLDPALGSGVIVTTFTDVFGFFSFLGIATLLIEKLT